MQPPAAYDRSHASAFQEASVADAYAYRPPYPPQVFDVLAQLLPQPAQRILDAGCGTGALARNLTHLGLPIDAVDISAAMIARGQQLPGGNSPLIHWQLGSSEMSDLTPPYSLILAGESLHWMDWQVVLPRFARVLEAGGQLAILDIAYAPLPWSAQLGRLIQRYSTNQRYHPIDLIAELTSRGLFAEQGRVVTTPWRFRQSVDAYIESFHGRASFSRERMAAADADAFDAAVRALVLAYTREEVALDLLATIVWGRPLASA